MSDPRKAVVIDYMNWRGERRERTIIPLGIAFENNEWHPETQWVLNAVDLESGKLRCFALRDIFSWKPI